MLVLAWGGASRAAVRFDMFVGYDGLVPQGSWLPVTFEIQNDGEGFVGTIEVNPGQLSAGQERWVRVELPSGTTKRLLLPVFATATWNPTWSARLLDERRRVRAEAEGGNIRRFNSALLPVAAAMTRHLPTLPEVKAKQDNMRPVIGRMPAALFPDHPLVLDGLDVFHLSSERALELKPAQVGALLAWMRGGGHLIVSIEQPGHLTGPGAWLAAALPWEVRGLGPASRAAQEDLQKWVTGSQRVDGLPYRFTSTAGASVINPFSRLEPDPAFTEAPLQVAQIAPGAASAGEILIGTREQPLVLTAQRGLGRLTALAFAPELEPFRGWRNAPWFWARMVDIPPELFSVEWPNQGSSRPIEAVFGAMIDSRQIRKLPVGWLLLLLVAYLLVIGPLDQYWLKKLNRQMLTWLTFPAYVAIFSLLIYFIGYKLRAGETEWTELHVVDVVPHDRGADIRGRTFGSIYSPVNERYTLENETPFATLRGEFTGNYGAQESARGRIEQRPQGVSGILPVPVWTSQLFVSDWWRPGPTPVTLEADRGQVRVANHLERPLVAARVILKGRLYEFPDVPPGGTVSRELSSLRSENLVEFVTTHAASFSSAAASRQQVFADNERGRISGWTNAVLAASFISRKPAANAYETFQTPRGFDLAPCTESGQAVFIAWAPGHSLLPPLNQFAARRSHRDTVVRAVANPER